MPRGSFMHEPAGCRRSLLRQRIIYYAVAPRRVRVADPAPVSPSSTPGAHVRCFAPRSQDCARRARGCGKDATRVTTRALCGCLHPRKSWPGARRVPAHKALPTSSHGLARALSTVHALERQSGASIFARRGMRASCATARRLEKARVPTRRSHFAAFVRVCRVRSHHARARVPSRSGTQPGFYAEFADRLAALADAEVVVLGLAGHVTKASAASLDRSDARRTFGLEEQLQHVVDRARPHMERAHACGLPFTLVGHSIGAWIAFRAAQRLSGGLLSVTPADPSLPTRRRARSPRRAVAASVPAVPAVPADPPPPTPAPLPAPGVVLLCPFLENEASMVLSSYRRRRQLVLAVVPWLKGPIGLAIGAVSRLPERARRALLAPSLAPLAPSFAEMVVHDLCHRHALRNILALVLTEFALLHAPFDPAELTEYAAEHASRRRPQRSADERPPASQGGATASGVALAYVPEDECVLPPSARPS